jgi:hypothetical protein
MLVGNIKHCEYLDNTEGKTAVVTLTEQHLAL